MLYGNVVNSNYKDCRERRYVNSNELEGQCSLNYFTCCWCCVFVGFTYEEIKDLFILYQIGRRRLWNPGRKGSEPRRNKSATILVQCWVRQQLMGCRISISIAVMVMFPPPSPLSILCQSLQGSCLRRGLTGITTTSSKVCSPDQRTSWTSERTSWYYPPVGAEWQVALPEQVLRDKSLHNISLQQGQPRALKGIFFSGEIFSLKPSKKLSKVVEIKV